MPVFLYGPFMDQGLLTAVLGLCPAVLPASLPDYGVMQAGGLVFLCDQTGGLLYGGLYHPDEAALLRLDYYFAALGYGPVEVRVMGALARTYRAAGQGAPWDPVLWQEKWADLAREQAHDIMALYGHKPASDVARRFMPMGVRAGSRIRARDHAPATLRHHARQGDVQVEHARQPYANFFAVEEYDLRFRQFDGKMSACVNRAVFLSGDAVTLLPYDPMRDRVLLIEQFRAAVWGRGDPQPWLLEAIAGRIDPGETPQQAAVREAREEAGLQIDHLESIARYYPSPGAKSEYIYSYLGLCSLPDGIEGVFGLEGEAENIRGHLVGFDDLMALVTKGEIENGPLLTSIFWLDRYRQK